MSDALSTAWINGYIDEDGTLQNVPVTPAPSTIKRQNGVKQICNLAKKQGVPVDTVVTNILNASQDQLCQYVMYNGETPLSDPSGLALQAALIRAATVGNISKICNVPDDSALLILEQHEQDAIDTQSYDINKKLTPDVQAALCIVMQAVAEQMSALGSSGNMNDIMTDLSTFVSQKFNMDVAEQQSKVVPVTSVGNGYRGRFSRNQKYNGIDATDAAGIDDPSDYPQLDDPEVQGMSDTTDFEVPSLIPVSTTLAPVSVTNPSTNVDIPVLANASNLPVVTSASVNNATYGTTAGGVINAFTTISNVLAGAAKSVGTVVSGTNQISQAINNAGAGALQTWVQNNMVEVIGIILFIGVVIYVATRRKG